LFTPYSLSQGIVDEYTLSTYLGRSEAATDLEKHYATFINRESFKEMRDAGFDHVRISFPYWLIENVNPDDPYVEKVGWRYLLRGIEWAREYGLRINICLHAAPGSQNGLYHRYFFYPTGLILSGHEGSIGWLNGYLA
jgi:glucan 1,3-beta-glucosidase